MKEECPIGLVCEHFDCRPKVCRDYAAPIDLPYEIWLEDGYYPKGAFICQLPEFEEYPDREESDWVLYNRAERNFRIARIRTEMEAEGWGGLCELPYWYNTSEQALEVLRLCFLEGEDFIIDTAGIEDCDCMARGFAPALPLDLHFIPNSEEIQRSLGVDGFCHFLIWDDYYEFDM